MEWEASASCASGVEKYLRVLLQASVPCTRTRAARGPPKRWTEDRAVCYSTIVEMNVVLVSHCDFTGNSAMHVFSVANELSRLGVNAAVCIPNKVETVAAHGTPNFELLDYQSADSHGFRLSDGRGPDLVHAWTPRESVRRVSEMLVDRYRCP